MVNNTASLFTCPSSSIAYLFEDRGSVIMLTLPLRGDCEFMPSLQENCKQICLFSSEMLN